MPQTLDTAGSTRARLRLLAVLVLGMIVAYWGIYAIYLLFLPEGSPGAIVAVMIGAACLILAGIYALITWGTAKRIRGLHIAAIVVTALAVFSPFGGQAWDVWLVAAVNLVALVMLAMSIPHKVVKAKPLN